jgi:hypothetical protein
MARKTRTSAPVAPITMPVGAVGFIAPCIERDGILALFRPDGSLSQSFGRSDTLDTVRAMLPGFGFTMLPDGSVTRA